MDNDIFENTSFTLGEWELGECKPPSRDVLLGVCRELRIWRLCGRTACRRAGGCAKNPGACLERFRQLVPEEARMWIAGLMVAARQGVPLEEAVRVLQPEYAALEAWRAIVDPPRKRRVGIRAQRDTPAA